MDYLTQLFNQFNQSRGYKNIDLNSENYTEEFYHWLYELRKQTYEYLKFSESTKVELSSENYIELNKGKYDTLFKHGSHISTYADTLGEANKDFIVYQGEPYIKSGSIITKGQVVDTYFTQNPFTTVDVAQLGMLHNNGYFMCIGMFGKNKDKNKQQKIYQLKSLISSTNDNYDFNYETNNDDYYCILSTKRNVKELVKTK